MKQPESLKSRRQRPFKPKPELLPQRDLLAQAEDTGGAETFDEILDMAGLDVSAEFDLAVWTAQASKLMLFAVWLDIENIGLRAIIGRYVPKQYCG